METLTIDLESPLLDGGDDFRFLTSLSQLISKLPDNKLKTVVIRHHCYGTEEKIRAALRIPANIAIIVQPPTVMARMSLVFNLFNRLFCELPNDVFIPSCSSSAADGLSTSLAVWEFHLKISLGTTEDRLRRRLRDSAPVVQLGARAIAIPAACVVGTALAATNLAIIALFTGTISVVRGTIGATKCLANRCRRQA